MRGANISSGGKREGRWRTVKKADTKSKEAGGVCGK